MKLNESKYGATFVIQNKTYAFKAEGLLFTISDLKHVENPNGEKRRPIRQIVVHVFLNGKNEPFLLLDDKKYLDYSEDRVLKEVTEKILEILEKGSKEEGK